MARSHADLWKKILVDPSRPWDKQSAVLWARECHGLGGLIARIKKETGEIVSDSALRAAFSSARQRGFAIPHLKKLWAQRASPSRPPGSTVDPAEADRAMAAQQAAAQRSQIRALQRELVAAKKSLDMRESMAGVDEIHIKPPKKRKKSQRAGVPIIMASDWHVEEVINSARMNGVNEYNPEIARQRAEAFFQGAAAKIKTASAVYDCKHVVIWAGGDFITGFIHESYLQSNAMTPTEAVRYWKGLWAGGMEMLLSELPSTRFTVVCSYGNHGRTTRKPVDGSIAAANSYEHAAYLDLADRYAKNNRVTWRVALSTLEYVRIYDWTLRFTHGDKGVKYRDAIGGISTAVRKACMGWDTSRRADYTIMGHWHQWLHPFNDVIVNGSLCGYSPFALDIKARWEPPQQGFWILDEERGRRHTESIWVSDYGARLPGATQ